MSEIPVGAKGSFNLVVEPVQGRVAAPSAGDTDYDSGDGECRAQRHSRLFRAW